MGSRHFDLPRRTRADLILGLGLGAIAIAFIVNMLLSVRAPTIAPLSGGLIDLLFLLTLPFACYFGIARRRWLAEIDRFIDRYLGCLSKPGDMKIINDCRADLIKAIDRLVVHDIEA